jgi:FO synthase
MYGHIDGPEHWAAHIALLRDIQKRTGGFTEFVPLGFVHYKTPLFLEHEGVRPGPTRLEHIRMHAVARLMLDGWIDNIQASWVKLGPDLARQMLTAGVNDMGGTLMNESISRAAGGEHGQEMLPEKLATMIRDMGRRPVRRNTIYQIVETFDEPVTSTPLHHAVGDLA